MCWGVKSHNIYARTAVSVVRWNGKKTTSGDSHHRLPTLEMCAFTGFLFFFFPRKFVSSFYRAILVSDSYNSSGLLFEKKKKKENVLNVIHQILSRSSNVFLLVFNLFKLLFKMNSL